MQDTLWALTSPTGDRVALVAARKGEVQATFDVGFAARRLALSDDGRLLVAAGDGGSLAVWDVLLARRFASTDAAPHPLVGLAVDDREVEVACADGLLVGLGIPSLAEDWRATLADVLRDVAPCGWHWALCGDEVRAMRVSAAVDGESPVTDVRVLGRHPGARRIVRGPYRTLGVAGGDRMQLWDANGGERLADVSLPGISDLAAYVTSGDEERVAAVAGRGLHLYATDGKPLRAIQLEEEAGALLGGAMLGVALPGSGRLALFGTDGRPRGAIEGWGGSATAVADDAAGVLRQLRRGGDHAEALLAEVTRLLHRKSGDLTEALWNLEQQHLLFNHLLGEAWLEGRFERPEHRVALAAWLRGRTEWPAALAALRGGLEDPGPTVRQTCRTALQQIGDLPITPTTALARPDPATLAGPAHRDPALVARLLDTLAPPPDIRTVEAISERVGLRPAEVDAELAAVLVDAGLRKRSAVAERLAARHLRRHRAGWSLGHQGVWEDLRAPDPYDIEDWIADGAWPDLDAALCDVGLKAPRSAGDAPRLAWRDGTPLSVGAQGWYLTHLLAPDQGHRQVNESHHRLPVPAAAAHLDAGLSEDSRMVLARWLIAPEGNRKPASAVPTGVDAIIDWLGGEVEAGRLDRRRVVGLRGFVGPQARRWWYRWVQLRGVSEVMFDLSVRDAMPLAQDRRIDGLWPLGDDPSGSAAEWRGWLVAALQRAMAWQQAWSWDRFEEAFVHHPVAGPLVAGLVLETDAGPACWIDGALRDAAGTPIASTTEGPVRIAHPAGGSDGWPTPSTPPPFDQRGWRVFLPSDLPALPDHPVPFATWKRRCRALGLASSSGYGGGIDGEVLLVDPYRIEIGHAGYGGGRGGRRAIENVRVAVRLGMGEPLARLTPDSSAGWDTLAGWLRSEIVSLLRALFGDAPSPPWAYVLTPDVPASKVGRASRTREPHAAEAEAEPPAVDPVGAPAPVSGPAETSDRVPGVGDRVVIASGKGAGGAGVVFWVGPSKFGHGQRAGVRGDDGQTWWVALDQLAREA